MSYLFQASICLVLFYVGYFFLLKDNSKAFTNRVILLIALICSAVIPLLSIPIFPKYITHSVNSGAVNFATNEVISVAKFNWSNVILLAYGVGFLISFVRLSYKLFVIFRIISNSKKERKARYIKVYTDKLAISSFLWFVFIPLEKEKQISNFELTHEQAHIQQKHSFDILLLSIFQIVFWFNPILLFYKKSLVELHEYLADEYTINSFGKQAYLNFLSDKLKCQYGSQNVLIHNFYSLIKKRIIMMNSEKNFSKWRVIGMFPLLLLSLHLFSFKSYAVNPNQANKTKVSGVDYPPIPANLKGKNYDTVFVFNPTTKTEEVKYVEVATIQLDTIYTFDPDTKKETMKVVPSKTSSLEIENSTSEVDSIWVFDPETKKEQLFIENRKTGKRVLVK